MIDYDVDILIVGGGLTGALLHIALAPTNLKTLLIDSKSLTYTDKRPSFDARSIALSSASIRILKNLNIWPEIKDNATNIASIHISEKGRFGNSLIQENNQEQLGCVVEMQFLLKAISKLINRSSILEKASLLEYSETTRLAKVQTDTKQINIKTKLVVAADGTNSKLREFCNLQCNTKKFNEIAVVANIGLARSHKNIAYERFTKTGPLALLPMTNQRASLVWSLPATQAKQYLTMPSPKFLDNLQLNFGYRLGRFIKVGTRATFPLQQVIMPITHTQSIVFIGNAAHTLHPVAGQGFNLGLRDVATLVQCILQYGLDNSMLRQYQAMRRHDQKYIKLFTENLISIFQNKAPLFSFLRGLGLITLDNSKICKNLLESYARGFAGYIPDLVCGIPIYPKEEECKM